MCAHATRSYYSRMATISFSASGSMASIREWWLIESSIWSSEYGTLYYSIQLIIVLYIPSLYNSFKDVSMGLSNVCILGLSLSYRKPHNSAYFTVNLTFECLLILIYHNLTIILYLACGGNSLIVKYTGHMPVWEDENKGTPSVFKVKEIFAGLV